MPASSDGMRVVKVGVRYDAMVNVKCSYTSQRQKVGER